MESRALIGVLALQGAFREHARMLRAAGAEVVEVRLPEQLERLDGLVIPGGESTTILKLASLYGLDEAIREFAAPVFGTCAGLILVDRDHLGLGDFVVDRNAYGRQVASFEADLALVGGSDGHLRRRHVDHVRHGRADLRDVPRRAPPRCSAGAGKRANRMPRCCSSGAPAAR